MAVTHYLRGKVPVPIVMTAIMVAGLAAMPAEARPLGSVESNYEFGVWEPGTYHSQVMRFKRYGPQESRILAMNDPRFGPETSVIDTFVQVTEAGDARVVRVETRSEEGALLSTDSTQYDLPGKELGLGVKGDASQILRDLGFELTGEEMLNGRRTHIFTGVGEAPPDQSPPIGNRIESPIYYDLNPVGTKVNQWVDVETGTTLRAQRIVVDALGNETVIEDWQLLKGKKES